MLTMLKVEMISAFEDSFPGSVGVWMFDNSTGHGAFAPDALVASKLNLNAGGKQSQLRDGWFLNANGNRVTQPMSFPADCADVAQRGKPKGAKVVLQERGLWRNGLFGVTHANRTALKFLTAVLDGCWKSSLILKSRSAC